MVTEAAPEVPTKIREYADQTVSYVFNALGVRLEFDSDTLPLLDHYLRNVPADQTATLQLVLATAGAYFGETVRRVLGGRWDTTGEKEAEWRVVLPTGLNFSPIGMVAAAIARADLEDLDSELDAPLRMKPHVEAALQRMGELTVDEYYSLCGRLDTMEHLHEVLVAVAAQMMGEGSETAGDEPDDGTPEPVADEPSEPVN